MHVDLDRLMSAVASRAARSGAVAQLRAAVDDLRAVEMRAQVVAGELIRRADTYVRQATGVLGPVPTEGPRLLLAEPISAELGRLPQRAVA